MIGDRNRPMLTSMIPDHTLRSSPVRVLVVAGRPLTRAALRSLLDGEPGVQAMAEAADLSTAIHAIRASPPDVVLVDRSALGEAGLKRLPLLAAAAPGAGIFLVGMGDHPRLEAHARQAGAAGYLRLDEAPERLSSVLASPAPPSAA
jgi:DNA-binding NarL/FixJ family response regulator